MVQFEIALRSIGEACAKYHDENGRNMKSKRIQCD
jgi:hypothetical protein